MRVLQQKRRMPVFFKIVIVCLLMVSYFYLPSEQIKAVRASSSGLVTKVPQTFKEHIVPQPPSGYIDKEITEERSKAKDKLSLQDLLDLALKHHPSLGKAWARAKASADSIGLALSSFYPKLSGGLHARQTDAGRGKFRDFKKDEEQKEWGASLGISYLLLDAGGRKNKAQAARKELEAANHLYNQVVLDLVLKVQKNYYQYVKALELLEARKQDLKTVMFSLKQAKSFYKSGQGPKSAELEAQAHLSKVKYSLASAKSDVRSQWRELATICRLPETPRREVIQPKTLDKSLINKKVEELVQIVKENNPQIKALEAQIKASRHKIKAAKSKFWPTLNLKAQSSVTDYSEDEDQIDGSIGLEINYDFFTGFANTYNERQAQSKLRMVRYKLAEEQLALREKLENDLSRFEAARDQLRAGRAYLKDSKKSYDLAKQFFQQGLGSMLQVTKAMDNMEDAKSEVVKAKMNMYIAAAKLAHSCGAFGKLGTKRSTWKAMGER